MSEAGAEIAALGLDLGSTTMKLAGVDPGGELVWHAIEPTEPLMEAQVRKMKGGVPAKGPVEDLPLVATGYGRKLVDKANKKVTEITCHAKGVFRSFGHGGTLIDIGGQDSKVIVISETGSIGGFVMNDKCAAGTGRFLEVVAGRMRLTLSQLSETALAGTEEASISSTCTVFAESEIVSLLARGESVERIVRGLHRSLIQRVAALARGAGVKPPLMLSGGVAQSAAVRAMLAEARAHDVVVPERPQLMGAYGAALLALG